MIRALTDYGVAIEKLAKNADGLGLGQAAERARNTMVDIEALKTKLL